MELLERTELSTIERISRRRLRSRFDWLVAHFLDVGFVVGVPVGPEVGS